MITSKIIEPKPKNKWRLKYTTERVSTTRARTGQQSDFITLSLAKKQIDVKARVLGTLLCLGISKLATVLVPVFYEEAVDVTTDGARYPDFSNLDIDSLWNSSSSTARLCRIASSFARVGQRAIEGCS